MIGSSTAKRHVKDLLSHFPFLLGPARASYHRIKAARTAIRWRMALLLGQLVPSSVQRGLSAPNVEDPHTCSTLNIPPSRPGVKVITTLKDLDAQLILVDEAGGRSDDDLRSVLASFEFRSPDPVPADPNSEAYRSQQHELYLNISGATSYTPANELSEWLQDVEKASRIPFPYYTRSAQTVGDQLMALGFIIKTMNLPSGASVLEFGPGWGNTSEAMARMGYAVTAVDIEPKFTELIDHRAKRLNVPLRTICGSFGPVIDSAGKWETFDCVLFFECFHHCADHLKLIKQLSGMTKDSGIVAFASEPITEDFPVPWGLRLDGMSVWSIRRFKWLELGFKESYFVRTMLKHGWIVEKKTCADTHLGVIFLARRNPGRYEMSGFLLPKDEDATWAPRESAPEVGVRFTAGASRISLDEDERWHSASVQIVNSAPFAMDVEVNCGSQSVCVRFAPQQEKAVVVPLQKGRRLLRITSLAWSPKKLKLNADDRILGVAVRDIQFFTEGLSAS
jgi:SAM-dependent methyltransferase